ncbi:helicase-related protein [uncultured Roseobacter sp.]|uniref:preprotein translocase subunit SecA n=1 Tax=uncultured Roseobacter sp. TaxID=114847 RepID=UPI00261E9EDF|nr:helicase-related protein [uncultured Roseobacter sp.]
MGAAPYAELADPINNGVDRWLERLQGTVAARMPVARWRLSFLARRINRLGDTYADMSDDELRSACYKLRPALLARRGNIKPVLHAFAIVREVTTRVLEKRHYHVQLMGALALFEGRMVEMATGEGKTLTGLPAAVVAALSGDPVHVVTVNDYLAGRDAEELRPVIEFLGLSIGIIDSDMETQDRQAAYATDITFLSNKNMTFDYLRDRVALRHGRSRGRRRAQDLVTGQTAQGLMLRGLAFAIVDEADSVFVDEARTPLILSSTGDDPELASLYSQALSLARSLREGVDFELDHLRRSVTLTETGKTGIGLATEGHSGLWQIRKAREELLQQALSGLHFFELGKEYIVEEDEVRIVDEFTGRVMADRSWQGGLHQMIETKEGVPITGRKETLARITYQRFFRRYLRLAGMTGTGMELSGEFLETYGLKTVKIPTHRTRRRRHVSTRVLKAETHRWDAVAKAAQARNDKGQPVLIGTRSVEGSERAAEALAAKGLKFEVLNAKQNEAEAEVVAQAGQKGRITIATNIAGRGTDISLGNGVRELGGLHVILTEFHESSRIDRQLYGRAGRQGDPGSTEAIVSLEDELFLRFVPRLTKIAKTTRLPLLPRFLRILAQRRAEAEHATTRREQTALDKKLERSLAFTGAVE